MTEFGKTLHVHTKILNPFLLVIIIATFLQALSRHSNKTAIDMQVSLLFTDNFLPTLLSHEGPKQTL